MEFTESVINQYMADFLLPFARISALVMSMMGLGSQNIPTRVKLFLCLAITFAIMPAIPPTKVEQLFSFQTTLLVFEQTLIGVMLGFITILVMNTFTLAGQIIAMQSGLGFASLVDPSSGMSVPAVGQFFLILTTLLFWAMDGHLAYLNYVYYNTYRLSDRPTYEYIITHLNKKLNKRLHHVRDSRNETCIKTPSYNYSHKHTHSLVFIPS